MLSRSILGLFRHVPSIHQQNRCGFKSIYSLDKIYPNSEFDYSTKIEKEIKDKALSSKDEFHGYIPIDELDITYSKSSGPGGQNVNKVNTKVDVRFDLKSVKWIPEPMKKQLLEQHHTRITKNGQFYIQSDKTRSRDFNLADCLDKIRFIIRNLDRPPEPQTAEERADIEARARRAAQERLREKRENSLKKQGRQDVEM